MRRRKKEKHTKIGTHYCSAIKSCAHSRICRKLNKYDEICRVSARERYTIHTHIEAKGGNEMQWGTQ